MPSVLGRPQEPARFRPPPVCLLPSAHADGAADLRRGGAHRPARQQHPGPARRERAGVRCASRRHRDLLFDLEYANRPARRFLRQLPAEARDRRSAPRFSQAAPFRHPVALARLCRPGCARTRRNWRRRAWNRRRNSPTGGWTAEAAVARRATRRWRSWRRATWCWPSPVAATALLPLDPVARFHLGNGARIERINPLGDNSVKGMQQSFGVMVNYLYDLDELEENVENFAREGTIATRPPSGGWRGGIDRRGKPTVRNGRQCKGHCHRFPCSRQAAFV
jgi:hypothetical protein